MRRDFYRQLRSDAIVYASERPRSLLRGLRPLPFAAAIAKLPAMFIHTVYFYVNPKATEQARAQLLRDCREYLGKVPGVRHLWAGVPAMTPRDVVDNSYGVGLTVVLDDSKGHDVYQEHPLHKEFIARNKETWTRVQIYDHIE